MSNDMKKSVGAVFMDRDGVIIKEKHFQHDCTRIEYIPGALEALSLLPDQLLKIIVSNQSGVGRGYFSIRQAAEFDRCLLDDLARKGIKIDDSLFCPHRPEDNCSCRKPNTRLFLLAQQRHSIDFEQSWMIGDKSSDIQAGKNIGAKTILVLTGYAGKEPGALDVKPDYIAGDLKEAVEILLN